MPQALLPGPQEYAERETRQRLHIMNLTWYDVFEAEYDLPEE
jgi:hypothetical protein